MSLASVEAYVALGANLGDRLAQLRAAVAALDAHQGITVTARSRVYETEAVADEPQPPYLNAVVRLAVTLDPAALLAALLATERTLGRVRPPGVRKAPRLIDLDLLLWSDRTVREPELVVPHPGMLERPFVRIPLADVARVGLRHPETGEALDVAPACAAVRPSSESL